MLLAVKITPLLTNSLFLCMSSYFENRTLETQYVLSDQDQLNFWSGGILFLKYLDSIEVIVLLNILGISPICKACTDNSTSKTPIAFSYSKMIVKLENFYVNYSTLTLF